MTIVAAQLSVDEIMTALQNDSRFFINFFMAEQLDVPTPDFHVEVFDLMVHAEVDQAEFAIPRAHAKTTLAKLAGVYYLLFTEYDYLLYMSAVAAHSIASVNDIVGFLQCDNFVAVFGPCIIEVEQAGKGYYHIRLPNGKLVILKAFGTEQSVRGTNIQNRRPQLIICDDIEDNKNIASETLFMNLKRWLYGPFKKCVDPWKNKWIWLGNMIAQRSMLFENSQSEFWFSRVYGCLLQDGTALWPDLWPIDKLRQDFMEYQKAGMADVWFAEMMNMPSAGGHGIIKADEITYRPQMEPGIHTIGFITNDLALSKETWADEYVCCVHMWDDAVGVWQIAEEFHGRGVSIIDMFWKNVEFATKWRIGVIGIENVAFQAALEQVFAHYCLIYNIPGLNFYPITARARKSEHIMIWAGMLKAGEYALTDGDFAITQQLLAFDPKKNDNQDDRIDAAAMGVKMLHMYTYEIFSYLENRDGVTLPPPQTIYEISRI